MLPRWLESQREEETLPGFGCDRGLLEWEGSSGTVTTSLRDICGRIGRFNEAFGARLIRTVSVREIGDWLHGISLGPQSVVNYRAVANAFFSGSPVKLDDGSHLVIDRTLPLGGRKVNPAFTPSTTTPLRSDKNATPTNFFKAIRGLSAALSLSRAVPEIY